MAGSWREILESAAADEARREAECQGGERVSFEELHPPAGSPGWDEPELSAFLTRLASPPDTGSAALAEASPASSRRGPASGRERAADNSHAVAAARAPAEAEKSAPPACAPAPEPRRWRPWRGFFMASLLAVAVGISAVALLFPGARKPDTSQSPSIIEASRVRVETPSHRSHVLKSRHKRTAAGRPKAYNRCDYDPDMPACRWRRYRD